MSEFIKLDGDLDYILHFASPASPIDYLELPIQTLKVGALGTHNALGLAKAKKAVFLLASTSEVYGDPLVHPQPEEYWGNVNPIGPRGVYDEAKRFAEAIPMAYHRTHGINTKIVRIFNTYGPRQSARAVIPTIITQIANRAKEIKLGDLTPTRDFNYVEDICRGFILLAESDTTIGETINIGSNTEISVGETLQLIKELMSSDVTFTVEEQRKRPEKSEVFRLWCDNKKIEELTGFKSQVDIRMGLQKTIDWIIQPDNLKKYKAEIYNV